ncbi:hypothetical protein [Cryptosporangium phraense]|uniref:Uncharacterized protein n=1 Tax=Cryptosporangium phraense TaxID=2593070 RepID=A0A545ARR8_9ACTN|nr:hypothetical protein [Cryptosporangium phraense]TQS44034.1 hypothetical protein FL583_16400 [Cryptosporangium phraense]
MPATHSTPNFADVSAALERLLDAGRARMDGDTLVVDSDAVSDIPPPGTYGEPGRWRAGELLPRAFVDVPGLAAIDEQVARAVLSPVQAEQVIADLLDLNPEATRRLSRETRQALPRPTRLATPPAPDTVLIRVPASGPVGYHTDGADGLIGRTLNFDGVSGVILRATPAAFGDAIDLTVQFPRTITFA